MAAAFGKVDDNRSSGSSNRRHVDRQMSTAVERVSAEGSGR